MGKQFLLWFAAALVGGLLMLTIGTYLGIGGLPSTWAGALFNSEASPAPASTPVANNAPASDAKTTTLKPGDMVPADFTLPNLDGQPQSLAQFRGKRVLVNFWATWCHPCLEEMPALAAAQKAHPEARIIGIAMDNPKAVHAWLKKTPVDYPIWQGLAADNDVAALFGDGPGLLPYSVLIGSDGRIRATHLGKLSPQLLQQWLQAK
ncbi:MAG TPA: redoxin domain-containing protein [Oleiagrimonas sp.]|nr:redoxin domain-containing protein [Oleiagrimonas sp.]